jgi:large subunit ribosomal protein L21
MVCLTARAGCCFKYFTGGKITLNGEFKERGNIVMYAIIETGGKQYRVSEGSVCTVEKIEADAGSEVSFSKVLAIKKEDGLEVGSPYLEGAKVLARVLSHGKAKKIIVFKYKPKKNYRKKQGHRQPFTRVLIEKIEE